MHACVDIIAILCNIDITYMIIDYSGDLYYVFMVTCTICLWWLDNNWYNILTLYSLSNYLQQCSPDLLGTMLHHKPDNKK